MNPTEDYLPTAEEEPAPADDRLLVAMREYQAALDKGTRPSRSEFLSRYPDIAADLAECLDGLEFVRSAASRLAPITSPYPGTHATGLAQADGTLGDFQLVREIGRGGMGVVYEAIQLSLGRRVALKVLPLAGTLDPRQLQRFENEARAAAHLHHGNIVPVFAVGRERGVPYYAMQFIDGQTLAAVIEDLRAQPKPATSERVLDARPKIEPFPSGLAVDTPPAARLTHQSLGSKGFFRRVAQLGVQAADALEYAHQMGVVHRDIKPANLLLDARGHLWVTDFGLARFQSAPGMTSPGDLVGTLRYMSPEQAAGQPVIDPRSDVYSLGTTLYELLTQEPAFSGSSRQECLRQILEEDPVPLQRLNRAIPPELETIILKAMAKQPEDRYPSARELADDLRRFLDDQPVQARRPGLRERATKWARRHRSVVISAVVILLFSVVGLSVASTLLAQAYAREHQKATEAAEQRARAEASFRQAQQAVKLFEQIAEEELGGNPALQRTRQRMLEAALSYYQDFIDQHAGIQPVQGELEASRARVETILGELATLLGMHQYMHLHHRGVQEELGLSKEKREELKKMDARRRQAFRDFWKLEPSERQQRHLALAREQEAEVARLLDPGQKQRFRQIALQFLGPQAFSEPDVLKALALTASQKKSIRALQDQLGPPGGKFGSSGGPGSRRRGGGEDIRKKKLEKILELLTPTQKAKWQKLIGEPYKGEPHPGRASWFPRF